jgi:hypothetical protein
MNGVTCASEKYLGMKKNSLDFEPNFDFKLIAIISPLPSYTLCWWIENKFKQPFKRINELVINTKKPNNMACFQVFQSINNEDDYEQWTVIGNKSGNGLLLPEQKVVDYYLKIEGEIEKSNYLKIIGTLKQIPGIVHHFDVNPKELKSKANLVL